MNLENYKFLETKDDVDYYVNDEGHKVGVNHKRMTINRGIGVITGAEILDRVKTKLPLSAEALARNIINQSIIEQYVEIGKDILPSIKNMKDDNGHYFMCKMLEGIEKTTFFGYKIKIVDGCEVNLITVVGKSANIIYK